jgi:DNA-binding transcriptional LysR family regulator
MQSIIALFAKMDYFKQLTAFRDIIETGSISRASRKQRRSPGVLSRQLAALERRFGVKLVQRTTRALSLTPDGAALFDGCQRALQEIAAAEENVARRRATVSGRLVISAPASFGRRHVAPHIPAFLAAHPGIELVIHFSERLVNLVEEGVDIAIRIARLKDSSLVAVRLARNRRVVCAAPAYLARRGAPKRPADLREYDCLVLGDHLARQDKWLFRAAKRLTAVPVDGPLTCGDGAVIHEWARAGLGLAWRSTWEVGEDLRSGALVSVLDTYAIEDNDVYAVYPSRRNVATKVRVFVEFLRERFGELPYWDREREAPRTGPRTRLGASARAEPRRRG